MAINFGDLGRNVETAIGQIPGQVDSFTGQINNVAGQISNFQNQVGVITAVPMSLAM